MDIPGPDVLPSRIRALADRGARIGLLGGSFNPAHSAHLHISLIALRQLKLDAVWWLVSPQNPLKPAAGMASLEKRLARATDVARHPKIFVSAIETALKTQFTIDTIHALRKTLPKARLAWLMGGDSLATFHHWRRWEDVFRAIPIAVVARPGFTMHALASPAAVRFRDARAFEPARFDYAAPPSWIFLQERLDETSATKIRERGDWR
ncbi:MAG: nicotinate-nucleotide adenylyltransferase [Micropepsaceae bacterium]